MEYVRLPSRIFNHVFLISAPFISYKIKDIWFLLPKFQNVGILNGAGILLWMYLVIVLHILWSIQRYVVSEEDVQKLLKMRVDLLRYAS